MSRVLCFAYCRQWNRLPVPLRSCYPFLPLGVNEGNEGTKQNVERPVIQETSFAKRAGRGIRRQLSLFISWSLCLSPLLYKYVLYCTVPGQTREDISAQYGTYSTCKLFLIVLNTLDLFIRS
jgi:hypothetical protein